mgnify:CR=1 FL=1
MKITVRIVGSYTHGFSSEILTLVQQAFQRFDIAREGSFISVSRKKAMTRSEVQQKLQTLANTIICQQSASCRDNRQFQILIGEGEGGAFDFCLRQSQGKWCAQRGQFVFTQGKILTTRELYGRLAWRI